MEKLDIVFLEPDLGTLFSAIALAAGGLKALIIEGQPKSATKKAEEPEWLEFAREPYLLRGLRAGGFLEPLLNKLGLLIRARDKVEKIDPPFQVVTNQARVDIRATKNDLAREFSREFGPISKKAVNLFNRFEEMATKIYELLQESEFPFIPRKSGFFRKTSSPFDITQFRRPFLEEWLEQEGLDGDFREFIYTTTASLGVPYREKTPALCASSLIDSARRGIYRANLAELSKLVLEVFKTKGGYTFPMREIEAIEISGRRIEAIRATKANYIRAKLFVGSCAQWAKLTTPDAKSFLVSPSTPFLHSLWALLSPSALPMGMLNRVAFLSDSKDAVMPSQVARIAISKEFEFNEERCVAVKMEKIEIRDSDIRASLREQLAKLLPFYDEYVKEENYNVEPFPVNLNPDLPFLELADDSACENLLPTEGEIAQRMGLGFEVVSGRILARVILKKLGLRGEI